MATMIPNDFLFRRVMIPSDGITIIRDKQPFGMMTLRDKNLWNDDRSE